MDTASPKTRFAPHGYAGMAIIVAAEVLLFGGNQMVGHWFTPIVWTGYILFVDALVYKLKARSLLMNGRWFNYCCLTETVLSVYCFQGAHKRDKRLVTRGLVPKRILESFMQEQENEGSEKADRDCGLPAACALFFYGLISSDLEFNCSGMSFSLGNASPLYMKSDGCNANEIG